MSQLRLFMINITNKRTLWMPMLSGVAVVTNTLDYILKKIEGMITKFVLNIILHHVGMSYII